MLQQLKFLVILLACCMLNACGFTLRTPQPLAPMLKTMYVATATPNDPFIQQLDRMLVANGVTLVNDPKLAQSTLTIMSINTSNTMINSGGINVSGFYTAYLTVTFKVVDAQNNILIPTTTLQQNQNFSSSASQVLSSTNVAAQLTTNMQQALAENIISQLAQIPKS